jgi:hypothetical protein
MVFFELEAALLRIYRNIPHGISCRMIYIVVTILDEEGMLMNGAHFSMYIYIA